MRIKLLKFNSELFHKFIDHTSNSLNSFKATKLKGVVTIVHNCKIEFGFKV